MKENDETIIAQQEMIKILMGTIIKSALFVKSFSANNEKLDNERIELSEMYVGLADEYLDGPDKDRIIAAMELENG